MGFARGFDTYFELLSEEQAAPGFAAETFARAEDWLAGVDSRPFFLFLHTYQVHDPYVPPPDLREQFYEVPGEPFDLKQPPPPNETCGFG